MSSTRTRAFAKACPPLRIGERRPCVVGIVVQILRVFLFMVAFAQGLAWVVVAAHVSGAGMGLLSPALTVVVIKSSAEIGRRRRAPQMISRPRRCLTGHYLTISNSGA